MALQNAFGDLALDASLQSILTELQGKLDAGGTVALDAATLAALESITATVTNTDFPDAATLVKLEQIRVLLAGNLTINLPTGASTEAKQDTGNTSLASIDTKLTNPLPVSGTVTANIADVYVTGQGAQTTLGNNILLAVAGSGSYDTLSVSGQTLRSMYVQVVPAGTIAGGTIVMEQSNDNVTFQAMFMNDDQLNNGQTTTSFGLATGTNRHWSGPIRYRYIRFRLSVAVTGSGGSVQAFAIFRTTPYTPVVMPVAQPSSLLIVQPPTLTKATQSAVGFSIQPLRDAGRVRTLFSATAVAAGTTGTETAISLTKAADNGATSSAASFVITSAKRFRIEAINFCSRGHNTATAQITTFNFRINTAGAVTTTSTPLILSIRSATIASNEWDRVTVPIPDGMEILGDGTIQFGITANAVYTTNAPTWDVNIIGYEY